MESSLKIQTFRRLTLFLCEIVRIIHSEARIILYEYMIVFVLCKDVLYTSHYPCWICWISSTRLCCKTDKIIETENGFLCAAIMSN